MPVVNPDHLLDQADRLVGPPAGGAPRQADLRRAISNAYYAVFHAVVTEAADQLAGRTQRHSPRYALVYRSVDHGRLRAVCNGIKELQNWKKKAKGQNKVKSPPKLASYEPKGGFGPNLSALADAVGDLQEKRNLADYDPLFRVNMSDAALAVATARTAIARFKNANAAKRKAFVSLLVFPPR